LSDADAELNPGENGPPSAMRRHSDPAAIDSAQ
jgi:hypothetical protein